MKDHEFREAVNKLRDVALQYRDADQLRERISIELRAVLAQEAGPVVEWQEPVYLLRFLPGSAGWQEADKEAFDSVEANPNYERRTLYASPPAPVAVVTPDQLIAAIEAEQERLSAEDYLMDSGDCVNVIRETVACLDKVKELNQ